MMDVDPGKNTELEILYRISQVMVHQHDVPALLNEALEGSIVRKVRIHFQVVARIVLVVAAGNVERVEVQDRDTKILEVGQLLAHALDVTAVVIVAAIGPR